MATLCYNPSQTITCHINVLVFGFGKRGKTKLLLERARHFQTKKERGRDMDDEAGKTSVGGNGEGGVPLMKDEGTSICEAEYIQSHMITLQHFGLFSS